MPIRLDERLTAIANCVDFGAVADVGCDHGKLGYYLVATDRASKVIATDISESSLKKAEELSLENGVGDLMCTRLGDGLVPVADGEADTVIIAGLGGDVISEILARARSDGKSFSHFLLSPNTHPEKVRREIVSQGHRIIKDFTVECLGKRYTVIKTERGGESLDEYEIMFGKFYKHSADFVINAKKELDYKKAILDSNPNSETLAGRVALLKSALANAEVNSDENI